MQSFLLKTRKIVTPHTPATIEQMFCHSHISHVSASGFTLVETLVAVAVLIAGIIGPFELITRSLYSAPFSKNNLIAHNLAQEGIELARVIRDNNMLCDVNGGARAWNSNPATGAILQGYYEFSTSAASFQNISCGTEIFKTPFPITKAVATCNDQLLIDANGRYTYDVGGTASGFSRCVRVCSPPDGSCGLGNIPGAPPDGAPVNDADQMDVLSNVSWYEHGMPKSVTLRTRLYKLKCITISGDPCSGY